MGRFLLWTGIFIAVGLILGVLLWWSGLLEGLSSGLNLGLVLEGAKEAVSSQ